MTSGYISPYVWCFGVQQRRHIAICMKEGCACEEFEVKISRLRQEKAESEPCKEQPEGYLWNPSSLFQTKNII